MQKEGPSISFEYYFLYSYSERGTCSVGTRWEGYVSYRQQNNLDSQVNYCKGQRGKTQVCSKHLVKSILM